MYSLFYFQVLSIIPIMMTSISKDGFDGPTVLRSSWISSRSSGERNFALLSVQLAV